MEQIGIQELIQHVSRYVERVRRGEVIEITDDGATVARITPVSHDETTLDVLIAQGLVVPPSGSFDELLESPGASGRPGAPPTDVILSELREDRS
ncbi:type II toxin-antitoxin system Phd/YefM family antitoxin [Streptomyces boninensis]|uniref:type II toxin-antitoxin system Phd/YefM family antitoxin n=1 Tax=Streptomyces boninensis TaxID=2039455 RepID=UPI003B2121F2